MKTFMVKCLTLLYMLTIILRLGSNFLCKSFKIGSLEEEV